MEYINKETNMEVTEKLSQPNSTSTQVGSDKVLRRTTHSTEFYGVGGTRGHY